MSGTTETVTGSILVRSLLVSYAMQGLRRCWMPELGRYSHRFRFDVPEPCNESIPESDAFYTLNVFVGVVPASRVLWLPLSGHQGHL